MQSIRHRFEKIKTKNPKFSSIICFTTAVVAQGYSEKSIRFWFNRLVDHEDYASEDKRAVIADIVLKNKSQKSVRKEGKNRI